MDEECNEGQGVAVRTLDLSPNIDSVAVQRMIEEIRSGDPVATASNYDRTHNRHNR